MWMLNQKWVGRGGEVEEGGEMLICRFYTQPVSTQAGADGDDEGDDGWIKL